MRRCGECGLGVIFVRLSLIESDCECAVCGRGAVGRLQWDDGSSGAALCMACWRGYRIEHAAHEG